MQATNSSNSSATLNGYSLTAAAPSPGPDPPSLTPLTAPVFKPQASRAGPPVGRRLLGVPTAHSGSQFWSGRQQQLIQRGLSPGNTTQLQLPGLLAVLSQSVQHAQQLFSRTHQAVKSVVAKPADRPAVVSQHAQRAQHAQQQLSRTRHALKAAVLKLADCAGAVLQHAQQLLSRTRHALLATFWRLAEPADSVYGYAHRQVAQLKGRFGGAMHRRVLAAGPPDSVEVEVTVTVPSSQAGAATQAQIEGPSFAPALQQSLSDAGMHATLNACNLEPRFSRCDGTDNAHSWFVHDCT